MEPPWDAFICHRGPDTKKEFASFLRYALEVQGIRAFFDQSMVGGTNPGANMETAMHTAHWGIIVLSPQFFESEWCMKELGVFLERGRVLPVCLGMSVDECSSERIANRVGPIWEKHGGNLWNKCGMEEAAWRTLVDRIAKEVVVVKSVDSNDYWGDLINKLVTNLGRKLGRPVVEGRVVRHTVVPPYHRNARFLGREKELEEIHEALLGDQPSVSVSSMGGMGKTQLALEYIYRHLNEYWKVLWVDASANSLATNYLGLATDLDVTLGEEKGTEAGIARIREALERITVPCFLVFDDVADEPLLHSLLPRTGQCRVIVTSRTRLVGNFGRNIYLEKLSKDDALTLIRGSPHLGAHEVDLEALANRFEYLTLALSVCSAWLQQSGLNPAELMGRLDNKMELVQAFEEREVDPAFGNNPNLLPLFQASIEQIKKKRTGDLGERVLCVGGWFAGVPIRNELLSWAASEMIPRRGRGEEEIEDALDLLVRFNLATRGEIGSSQSGLRGLAFHTVVQSFGRFKGGPEGARAMVRALVVAGDVALDTEHFQHACDLATPSKKDPVCKVHLDDVDRPAAVRKILSPLIEHFFGKGLYFKVHELLTNVDIEKLPYEFRGLYFNWRVSTLVHCGQYEEALQLLERSLFISEMMLGAEHPTLASQLNNMAVILKNQGKYEKALSTFERSLHITVKAYGEEHPEVAATLTNMATLLDMQGKHEEALPMYERCLGIQEKARVVEHLEVAMTINNMAVLFKRQGKYAEALSLHKRSLHIRERELGPEHPDIALSLNNLANMLQRQGDHEEALRLYDRSLRISKKALGEDHATVAKLLTNMAYLLMGQGKYEEALPLYRKGLLIMEKALGAGHTDVGTLLNNMATSLGMQGKYDEALPLFKRSLAIQEKALGSEHLEVAKVLNSMAVSLKRQAKSEEALPLYQKVLTITEKVLGAEHPAVALVRSEMTGLKSQRKYKGRKKKFAGFCGFFTIVMMAFLFGRWFSGETIRKFGQDLIGAMVVVGE